jgi:hypothetical protein
MDMQKMLDNAVAAMRNERLKTSAQLTIGEIIIHLGNLNNKNLPVLFNFEKARPTCLDVFLFRSKLSLKALLYLLRTF